MESTHAENKMGYLPIRSLIIKMSLPMMVSMLVLATYNIVDSIFVNSLVARRLGEKRQGEADTAATNAMFLAICGGVVFAVLFGLLHRPMIYLFHADAEITEYAITYLSWVGIPAIFVVVQVMCEKLLQATGSTMTTMFVQLVRLSKAWHCRRCHSHSGRAAGGHAAGSAHAKPQVLSGKNKLQELQAE